MTDKSEKKVDWISENLRGNPIQIENVIFTNKGTLYAKKGDEVVCENGHIVARINENIPVNGGIDPEKLFNFTDNMIYSVRKDDNGNKKCISAHCKCGGDWLVVEPAILVRFNDGWRGN